MQELPKPLGAYYAAANEQNSEVFLACFADDALVHDEGKTHNGRDDIAAWNAAAIEKYNCQYEVLKCVKAPYGVDVTAKVSGTFPGSPIDLTYKFVLEDNLIIELGIK